MKLTYNAKDLTVTSDNPTHRLGFSASQESILVYEGELSVKAVLQQRFVTRDDVIYLASRVDNNKIEVKMRCQPGNVYKPSTPSLPGLPPITSISIIPIVIDATYDGCSGSVIDCKITHGPKTFRFSRDMKNFSVKETDIELFNKCIKFNFIDPSTLLFQPHIYLL